VGLDQVGEGGMPNVAEGPACKRPKYNSSSLKGTDWLLEHVERNLKLNSNAIVGCSCQ
jgi:hypothetical protein